MDLTDHFWRTKNVTDLYLLVTKGFTAEQLVCVAYCLPSWLDYPNKNGKATLPVHTTLQLLNSSPISLFNEKTQPEMIVPWKTQIRSYRRVKIKRSCHTKRRNSVNLFYMSKRQSYQPATTVNKVTILHWSVRMSTKGMKEWDRKDFAITAFQVIT